MWKKIIIIHIYSEEAGDVDLFGSADEWPSLKLVSFIYWKHRPFVFYTENIDHGFFYTENINHLFFTFFSGGQWNGLRPPGGSVDHG